MANMEEGTVTLDYTFDHDRLVGRDWVARVVTENTQCVLLDIRVNGINGSIWHAVSFDIGIRGIGSDIYKVFFVDDPSDHTCVYLMVLLSNGKWIVFDISRPLEMGCFPDIVANGEIALSSITSNVNMRVAGVTSINDSYLFEVFNVVTKTLLLVPA